MNYIEEKNMLMEKVQGLKKTLEENLPESSQHKVLAELEEDLAQDYYTMMVVGEFKHGKSTFVNALLGKDLMPRDVTPTTAAIHAIFHSEQPALHILKSDGNIVEQTLTQEELNRYTAEASEYEPEEIKYLKLFMDAPLLKNRVVLIDTPGVNDLNQQRSDITFQFLPRADAIIFMTSMDAAMKQTEKTFIQEFLVKNGLDKIIFAANFMDRIDEDELDDTIEYIENRIQHILDGKKVPVFPLSSREALEGKLNGDDNLIEFSGIKEIEAEIEKRIQSGTRSEEKLERFKWRFNAAGEAVKGEIETVSALSRESLQNLEFQLAAIDGWFSNQEVWKDQLRSYLIDRHNEIRYMVQKSLQHFKANLKLDIENRIHLFHGPDIKGLVESQIPIAVKSQFNAWVNQYSDYINELLRKTQGEVIKGLTASFKQAVHIQSVQGTDLSFAESVPMLSAKTGNATVKAGLVLGGAGTLAILLGGPFFLPLVGMAGLPLISQKLAEKQMENIKPQLISEAGRQINQLVDNFDEKVSHYVHNTIEKIKEDSLDEFSRLLRSYEAILKAEINSKKREAAEIQQNQSKLAQLSKLIEKELYEGVGL